MRKLLWLLVLIPALWAGYWFVAAQGIERGLAAWLDARRSEGWQAEAATIRTHGFPMAFETTVSDLALVDPATGLGWSAPGFEFAAKAHAPTRVEAVWPKHQRLLTPFEKIDVTADEMRASLGLEPGTDLALDTADLKLGGLSLESSAGWTAGLDAGSLVTRRRAETPLAHDIRFSAEGLRPARFVLAALDPTGGLPEVIRSMELDLRATFDAPWDRHAIEDRRPQPTRLDIGRLSAVWGDMQIEAAGALDVNEDGFPEGAVTVRAVNWREMLRVARAGGWLPKELLPAVERGLEFLAALSGNPETIDAPLTFSGGAVRIGPVPLGPAPLVRIR